MDVVGVYARVSTTDQDVARQLDELREFVTDQYQGAEHREYADVVSGATEARGSEYERLREDIAAGELDVVVVDELSRLSRLGAGEIHEFLQYCLEHDTGVRDMEVGLEIMLSDDVVDRAVSQLIAGVMGDLARVEHMQKLRRIRSGIRAAQDAGKWTGRPPRGFTVENGRLRVDADEFLTVRFALERVERGDAVADVAGEIGIPASTIRSLRNDRRELYLFGEADDDRVDAAVDELRPLDEPEIPDTKDMDDRIREIVRSELSE